MRGILKKSVFGLLLTCSFTLLFSQNPVDKRATRKTRFLLGNLSLIAKKGFMFGHQDDLAYGIGWKDVKNRSDVLETAGSYPAVYGWDIGGRLDLEKGLDNPRFINIKEWVRETYRRGGINTFSWHADNFTTNGNSWDTTHTVADLLPGGIKHEEFLHQLDLLAAFFDDLRSGFVKIPVVFRPWHEHNGDWFWWGKGNCTEEEYIALFRFTVDYLREVKKVNHILYAYSPDRSRLRLDSIPKKNYMYGYPGDTYVDIIGLDNYGDVGRMGSPDNAEGQKRNFLQSLELITAVAREKNKVAALTETGLEGVTNATWFTDILLDPIKSQGGKIEIAWILVWRNANNSHHYAPYTGHSSVPDFISFYNDESTFFESDLRNPYKRNKGLHTD